MRMNTVTYAVGIAMGRAAKHSGVPSNFGPMIGIAALIFFAAVLCVFWSNGGWRD